MFIFAFIDVDHMGALMLVEYPRGRPFKKHTKNEYILNLQKLLTTKVMLC